MAELGKNFIDGKWVEAKSGKTFENRNPANWHDLIGLFPASAMEDADLQLALEGALWGALGTTGQRCTATSRLILHREIKKELTEMLTERAEKIKIGDGLDETVEMGPLINKAARQKADHYVQIGKEEGARLLTGGTIYEEGKLADGCFYRPTIFDQITPSMRIAQEEIFGPVLSIMEVKSFEEAIEVLNGTSYGLSSSIYTRDVGRTFRAMRDIEGGVKETGNGHREAGTAIERIAGGSPTRFIPCCGLAPGFTQIIANHMVRRHEPVSSVSIRVGALPENPTNALKYNLTWSTDGLINEYGNLCEVLIDGRLQQVQPLEGYERLIIGDVEYEAFNTSGGLGTLARSLSGKVKELNYKTLRYLGHRDLMKFLMVDLQLNEYRAILKQILESAVPTTQQDRVVILIAVVGRAGGSLRETIYTKVIPHGQIDGIHWTAIQIATASSLASVGDLCLQGKISKTGFVRQEEIDFDDFIESEYGSVFR